VATAFSEFQRRVFIGFPRTDGEAYIAVKQAINDAIMALVSTGEVDSLLTTDTSTAATVDGQKSYHITTGLSLTRPRDIFSIILHDDSNSRKLVWVAPRELDLKIPYPERFGEGRPKWYTRFGNYIELIRIPDAAYTLYIRYSQWPAALTTDASESPFGAEWDHIITFLAKDIANAYLSGQYLNFTDRAIAYLKLGLAEAITKPDEGMTARPFDPCSEYTSIGETWKDPFFKRSV